MWMEHRSMLSIFTYVIVFTLDTSPVSCMLLLSLFYRHEN